MTSQGYSNTQSNDQMILLTIHKLCAHEDSVFSEICSIETYDNIRITLKERRIFMQPFSLAKYAKLIDLTIKCKTKAYIVYSLQMYIVQSHAA